MGPILHQRRADASGGGLDRRQIRSAPVSDATDRPSEVRQIIAQANTGAAVHQPTIINLSLQSHTSRLADELINRAKVRGVHCRTESGFRHCFVGRFLPGRRVTDFRIKLGRVTSVQVGFVID